MLSPDCERHRELSAGFSVDCVLVAGSQTVRKPRTGSKRATRIHVGAREIEERLCAK